MVSFMVEDDVASNGCCGFLHTQKDLEAIFRNALKDRFPGLKFKNFIVSDPTR